MADEFKPVRDFNGLRDRGWRWWVIWAFVALCVFGQLAWLFRGLTG